MTSLPDAIIDQEIGLVKQLILRGADVNEIDPYGFTPLIESAIVDNMEIAGLLIQAGANVNLQDLTGGTSLQWAVENNNIPFVELLLKQGANPNSYNFAGQPVLTMPILRHQTRLKNLLIKAGASLDFAQDYINVKTLGHIFELVGMANIISPVNQYVEVDFEGFYLEVTLALITESVAQYKNHFAARQMRRLGPMMNIIVEVLDRASQLIKFQQYRVDRKKYKDQINTLIETEPLIMPIGYEGHAITLVKFSDILVKCDRREASRLYDNVMIYRITRPENYSPKFVRDILYKPRSDDFVNSELPELLGLVPITEIKVSAQISGNCSWANVEACVPALLFLLSTSSPDFVNRIPHYKSISLNFFHQWREWNKDRALHYCLQSFKEADAIRKICKAEILAAILFQRLREDTGRERERIELILPILLEPKYKYILDNYVRSYCYEGYSEDGVQFLRLLESYGYKKK